MKDPDGLNSHRASWAGIALHAFRNTTGSEADTALGDLLCDLMHLCDENGENFANALKRAKHHYLAETGQAGPLTDGEEAA